MLLPVDLDAHGKFGRFAGLVAAAEILHSRSGVEAGPPGIVLFGLYEGAKVEEISRASKETAWILDWPGTAYLKMPFTADELRGAATNVLNGRAEPIPTERVGRILNRVRQILHWFERIKQGNAGTARIFADVERGHLTLTERILAPATCLSDKQNAAIEDLCYAIRGLDKKSDNTVNSELLRAQLQQLNDASAALEELKTQLRNAKDDLAEDDLWALARVSCELASVCATLFHSMMRLEMELGQATGEKHG